MEYLGISTTRSFCARMAWQLRRELGSRPQARSSRSSSFSSSSLSDCKAFAHDHVAGGAGAAHVAGVLDVDVVVQQRLADRGAGRRADLGALRAVFGVRQDFDDGHGWQYAVRWFAMFLPARACWMPRFMRAAAKASVPLASALVTASMALASSLARDALATLASARSISARSAASSRSPSASSALRVASSMRSASTRASASARACMSASAVVKLSCSMRAIWSSARP